jgi:hypothetical protein
VKNLISIPGTLAVTTIIAGLVLVGGTKLVYPHPATSINGDPLGWVWPPECCNSAVTSPTGDCATIDPSTVREGPDGYIVTLRVGDHPRLKTKGYTAVIPYHLARNSPSGEYGICLTTDGTHRFCFFAGGKNF